MTTIDLRQQITDLITKQFDVDAIYLYGSQAKGQTHKYSDWDIAVLFSDYEMDLLNRHLRPQNVEAMLEKNLKLYNKISVVDLEIVPPPLQYNIIRGQILYDRNVPHVKRVENAIISTIEKDYV